MSRMWENFVMDGCKLKYEYISAADVGVLNPLMLARPFAKINLASVAFTDSRL